MPQPADLSFSPGLTQIAVEYQDKAFIADHVLPPMPHTAKSGRLKSYDTYSVFGIEGGFIGPTSQADEVKFGVTEAPFSMDDFGFKGWVSQQEIDNADAPIDPMSKMTRTVMQKTLRLRERRIANAVMNTSNYAAGNQIDVAGAWATGSTDIWSQLLTAMDACASPPNVLVLDLASFRAIQKNDTILAAIKGTLAPQFIAQTVGPAKTAHAIIPDSVFCPALAAALGIERVVIGAAQYASSKKGQSIVKTRIWDLPNAGKGGAAFLRVAQDSVEDVVWGLHLYWKQLLRVLTWFDPDRGADGSTAIKIVETTTVHLIADDAGYLLRDTLVT